VKRLSSLWIALTLAVVSGLGIGTAFAYYKPSGSGSGHASVAAGNGVVTLATNASPATKLQPGGTGDLVLTVSNGNAFSVQITALSLTSVTGCSTPSVTLVAPSTSYLPATIAANANAARLVIPGALQMGSDASSDCQNADLTLSLTATVQR